ncbi:MAG: Rrf2 family transcriptional regulator [Pseudomonadota bacterium]
MKLNKQTSDAIDILTACKRTPDDLVKVGDISEELGLTKLMGLKLANRLNKAGLLRSVRGPHGGVTLTEQAEKMPLGQIIRRLENALYGDAAAREGRNIDAYFDEAFEAFLSVLDQTTLSDLAAKPSTRPVKKAPESLAAEAPVPLRNAKKRGATARERRA